MMAFLVIFEDFRRFSKICRKARRTFPNIFREFPKMSEDVRKFSKTFEEDPKMFRWCTNEFSGNLDISEIIDIFTCEDVVSFLSICYHSVYHWLLYNKLDTIYMLSYRLLKYDENYLTLFKLDMDFCDRWFILKCT